MARLAQHCQNSPEGIIMRTIFIFLVWLFSFSSLAGEQKIDLSNSVAVSAEAKILAESAKNVKVYAIIDRIYGISISDGTYEIEAEILMRWENGKGDKQYKDLFKEATYSGKHARKILDKIWHPEFIVKAELSPRQTLFTTVHLNKDGSLELFEKFQTKLPINTDIKTYPFGTLKLNLDIVAFTHDAKEMTFDPQSFSLGHEEQEEPVVVGNWTLINAYADKKVSHRLSTTDQTYSQNGFHFIIKHDFHDSMQKIFFPLGGILFLSLFLNLFSSMRFKENIFARVSGQLTLLLTIFALKFTLGDQVPHTHYLNLTDLLFIIGTGIVLLNFSVSVVLGDLYQRRENQQSLIAIETLIDRSIPVLTLVLIVAAVYAVF